MRFKICFKTRLFYIFYFFLIKIFFSTINAFFFDYNLSAVTFNLHVRFQHLLLHLNKIVFVIVGALLISANRVAADATRGFAVAA